VTSRVSYFCTQLLATTLVVVLLAFPSPAQPQNPPLLSADVTVQEVDQVTLTQLARAERFLAEKQYGDALETLRRAVDQQSDRLVAATARSSPKGFVTYVPLREEGQRRLCAMAAAAPEGLRLYRSQVDAEAGTLLAEARQQRSEAMLRRIVEQYLASSVGDDAALLLGDAALARGDVVAARAAWLKLYPALLTTDEAARKLGLYPALPWYWAFRGRQLTADDEVAPPQESSASSALLAAHPDTNLPLADIRARLVLASILEGNLRRAEWELEAFRALHATDQGKLGGRTGRYVDLLQHMLDQSRSWPVMAAHDQWPTFTGSPERNHLAGGDVDIAGQPLWTAELARIKSDPDLIGAGRLRVAEQQEAILSYHPIVHHNLAMVADAQSLRAWELSTGKLAWEVLLRDGLPPQISTNRQVGVPRFTLSAAEGVVVTALPTQIIPSRRGITVRREDLSRLVGVDLVTRKLVFEVVADEASTAFAGTPLIDRGRVFVVLRKQAEIRPQAFVACYDLASGRQLWQQQICSADSLGQGNSVEFASSLLSLSHDVLYCNTNLGAIAALSAEDGAIRWLTKYPRATFPTQKPERSDRHFFRDLNPCVIHQGQVLCAPADCDRIFSLDATSGQLIWTLPPGDAADAVHLLGVGQGHLFAGGDYLYWINVVTGQVVVQFPQALPIGPGLALPTPRGLGRGILAGENVYWPTESAIYVFAQSPQKTGAFYTSRRVEQIDLAARSAQGGNLVIAGKYLILATGERLYCFAETVSGRP